jgi:hypothetical protein
MKDLVNIQDYLFQVADVGDWEGEEEIVADRINAIYHAVWRRFPDDILSAEIDHLLNAIWNELRGSLVLLEADEDELVDWAICYVNNQLEEGIKLDDAADEEE